QESCLNNSTQLEDWQVHCDDQATYQHAENRHDHRLHQRGETIDHVVYLILVKCRHLGQHLVQGAGFLTNRGHLHRHGRECSGGSHGEVELHAAGDIALDLVGRRAEHHVTRGTSYRIQRIDQRHTGCKGGRQGAGETRYRRLVQNVTHHRHLQHQPVEPVTEFLGTCVRLLEGKGSTNKPSQHYVPPSLQCLR